MTVETGGAAASAEVTSAAIEQVDAAPAPLSDAPMAGAPAEPVEPKPVPSTRDALKAAAAKVEAGEGDAKDLKKGADLQRGDGGKFAAKPAPEAPVKDPAKDTGKETPSEAAKPAEPVKPAPAASVPAAGVTPPADAAKPSAHQVPARFSPDAKAAWETAPEPVRAEVARMERELTQGLEKHRKAAERDASIGEFHEMAEKHGTDVRTALTKYTNMESLLRQNPLKGIEAICDNIGVSLKDVARIVLEQPADETSSQSEATIRQLRQANTTLEERLAKVEGRFQQDDQNSVFKQIEDWAADKPHFELLAPHIATEMRNDRSLDLNGAYEAVLQKHPSLAALSKPAAKEEPAIPPAASSAAAPDLEAQTLKGSKSIKGAPGDGSEPVARKPSSSIKEALRKAALQAG